jgi:hypothetical protein
MLGRLDVKIGADISSFTGQIKKASSTLNQFGNKVAGIGKIVSAGISTPLIAAAGLSVKAFDTQIQAEKRLEAALRSAGEFTQATLKDFKEFAISLQNVTTVGDESTLKLLQVAKSMGLTNEQAKRAAKNSIALSKSMGINEQSAIRYTAALEQGDSTMLNRYLPTLRQVEDDSERAAKAQELLGQMFGAATAEAQSGLGPLTQIKNTFGDLQEEIGAIVLEYMKPFIEGLKNLVDAFKNSSKETKTFITQVMLIGSIAGPAIVTLALALKGLALAFAMLTSPVALVIGAIGLLSAAFIYVAANWDAFKERFTDIIWWKNAILDMAAFFAANMPLIGAGKVMAGNLLAMKTPIEDVKTEFLSLSDTGKKVFEELTGLEFDKVFSIDFDLEVDEKKIADFSKGIAPSVPVTVGEDVVIDLDLDTLSNELNTMVQAFPTPDALKMPFISAGQAVNLLTDITSTFTSSFGQGMSNVIVQGEKLKDTLENIGKLLASAAIQKAISVLLTGGLGGAGFFGQGGGIFGKILGKLTGKAVGGPVFSNTPYIVGERGPELFMPNRSGSIVPNGQLMGKGVGMGTQAINLNGEFRIKGTDLVLTLNEANYRLGR